MASEDEMQDRVEAADKSLKLIEHAVKSVKENIDTKEEALTNKKAFTEDDKIYIEANKRTLESLKRNLKAIKLAVLSDDEETNGVNNSLKELDEITKTERNNASNGIDIEDENCSLNSDEAENYFKELEEIKEELRKFAVTSEDDAETSESPELIELSADNGTLSQSLEDLLMEQERFTETWNSVINSRVKTNVNKEETKPKSEQGKRDVKLDTETNLQTKEIDQQTKDKAEQRSADVDAYQNLGMDNPLNAMLFSEQLIEYVLNKLGHKWSSSEGARNIPRDYVSTRFTKVIGETVLIVIDRNIEKISHSYKQLIEKNIHTIRSFRIEVCMTAARYFTRDYNHVKFLLYAALLAGLSAFYFASGNTQIAGASAQVLAYILNYYIYQLAFSPNFDWFTLHLEAQALRRDIEECKIGFIEPTGNPEPSYLFRRRGRF